MTDAEYLALLGEPTTVAQPTAGKSDADYLAMLSETPTYTPSATAFNPSARVQRQGATYTAPRGPSIFTQAVGGVTEPVVKLATSAVAKPLGDVAGLGAMGGDILSKLFPDYLGGLQNDPTAIKQQVEQALTYQPRTAAGQSEYNPLNFIPETIGKGVSAVAGGTADLIRGDGDNMSARGMAANAVQEAIPQSLGFIGMKKAGTVAKSMTPEAVAARAEAASAADWNRSAVIESAQKAREKGIILNPATVSGDSRTLLMASAGGNPHFNTAASIANKPKWNNMVREDLGIGENVPLTAATYDAVRSRIAKPYNDASKLGTLTAGEEILNGIKGIEIPEILPAGEAAAGKITSATDYILNQIQDGSMTGKMAVDTTKTLRKEAKMTFDSVKAGNQVKPIEIEAAKAKMRLAEKLDEMISSNITDPTWKTAFDESRRKMAQSYAYERATNLATRQIDPQVFAQEMQGRNYLTGNAKTMGEIAANHPEIANVYANRGETFSMPVRSGVVGTAGFALGSLYGAPVATSATAAGLASIGERLMGRKLRTEKGQTKYATPVDRRIPLPEESVTPVPAKPSGALTPYVSPTEVTSDIPNAGRPNFVFGSNEPPVTVVPPEYTQPQIGMSQGPVGGQTGALRMEDARIRAESMRQGQAAEAAAAAAESAAPRVPARGGIQFDLDPVTGKLIPTSSTTRGATPNIQVLESTGKNLQSAAEKLTANQPFNMTAAEKVAWGKTKVDVLQGIPELNGLSPAQIFAKTQDRAWTEQLVQKLRQQDEMYAQIAKRSEDQMAKSIARVKHEQLMDQLEQLENILSRSRPVRGVTQGPKTRAHQRGLLTGNE